MANLRQMKILLILATLLMLAVTFVTSSKCLENSRRCEPSKAEECCSKNCYKRDTWDFGACLDK